MYNIYNIQVSQCKLSAPSNLTSFSVSWSLLVFPRVGARTQNRQGGASLLHCLRGCRGAYFGSGEMDIHYIQWWSIQLYPMRLRNLRRNKIYHIGYKLPSQCSLNSVFPPNASEMIQMAFNLPGPNANSIYSPGCSISLLWKVERSREMDQRAA